MRFARISLVALAARVAYGYLDTSPFFLLSTSEFLLSKDQLQHGSKLTSDLASTLSHCPSTFYLLIDQPGVGKSDFSSPSSAPTLSRFLRGKAPSTLRSTIIIPEVSGNVPIKTLGQDLSRICGARSEEIEASDLSSYKSLDASPQVLSMHFRAPSRSQPERAEDLIENDRALSSLLELLHNRNYTVIYTTTPEELPDGSHMTSKQYEMSDYDQPLHTDLKRDLLHPPPEPLEVVGNQTMIDGPLFAKYQFFTPGLFMGLLVSLILLSILYVAISGISSLQVSYAAFDKENGPSVQKKAQ